MQANLSLELVTVAASFYFAVHFSCKCHVFSNACDYIKDHHATELKLLFFLVFNAVHFTSNSLKSIWIWLGINSRVLYNLKHWLYSHGVSSKFKLTYKKIPLILNYDIIKLFKSLFITLHIFWKIYIYAINDFLLNINENNHNKMYKGFEDVLEHPTWVYICKFQIFAGLSMQKET